MLILTKRKADESDSFLAQGGICMLRGEEDFHPYMEDTLRAGHYENDRDAVDLMIRSSNSIIRDLVRRGRPVCPSRGWQSGFYPGGSSLPPEDPLS